jgi:hypothetical protein
MCTGLCVPEKSNKSKFVTSFEVRQSKFVTESCVSSTDTLKHFSKNGPVEALSAYNS